MDVPQIVDQIAPLVGMATQMVAAAFQGLQSLKRSNVEEFFRLLLADTSRRDRGLKRIGQDEALQRLFFSIVDRVASEERKEKIRNWKNLLVHLATDFSGEEFKDTYTRILDALSALDLLVLHQAYSVKHEKGKIEEQVVKTLVEKAIENSTYSPIDEATGCERLGRRTSRYHGGAWGRRRADPGKTQL